MREQAGWAHMRPPTQQQQQADLEWLEGFQLAEIEQRIHWNRYSDQGDARLLPALRKVSEGLTEWANILRTSSS